MAKTLLLSLFKTFIISAIISIAATCIFYGVIEKNGDYVHAVPKIASGALFLNGILLVMSVPAIFLANPNIWVNKYIRALLYFSGPLVFFATTLTLKLSNADKAVYMLTVVVFLIVHAIFFYRITKSAQSGTLS